MFYSQSGQDEWVCRILKNKKNGFFLDIGASDGIEINNTLILERKFGWRGISIEASPVKFKDLQKNRKSINLNVGVFNKRGKIYYSNDHLSETKTEHYINSDTLDNILRDNDAPKEIDYLSIDIEGGEYDAFCDFPFDKWDIKLMTVEHNLYMDGDKNKKRLKDLLLKSGFEIAVENAICLLQHPSCFNQPYEDWWVNKKFQFDKKEFYQNISI